MFTPPPPAWGWWVSLSVVHRALRSRGVETCQAVSHEQHAVSHEQHAVSHEQHAVSHELTHRESHELHARDTGCRHQACASPLLGSFLSFKLVFVIGLSHLFFEFHSVLYKYTYLGAGGAGVGGYLVSPTCGSRHSSKRWRPPLKPANLAKPPAPPPPHNTLSYINGMYHFTVTPCKRQRRYDAVVLRTS